MTPSLRANILVIDDEPDLRTLYELTLLREGYRVEAAADLTQARAQLKEKQFDAVITDMRLPDGLGLELLREMVIQQRPERCVVITAHGSAENAVEALKAGAFDYLTKPVDLKQFRSVVASAIQGSAAQTVQMGGERSKASHESVAAAKPHNTGTPAATLQRLVGESAVMQTVKSRIAKVAGSMAPVLIHGESGTGKELVARAVHDCSHRAAGPFVAVNCSAIPENLLEAEFFGARKGAYTGSAQDRQGYFQAAKGGTLFLDEIGDLPLAMQSKLLRAIQERVVRPLGSTHEDTVDVRIVSATHKDLGAEVSTGSFRQDLYYRLNVIEIKVPPLRERREDLPDLCRALLGRICSESGLPIADVSAELLQGLQSHAFDGNVRELENLLHRAVALGEGGALQLEAPTTPQVHAAHPVTVSVCVPANLQDFLDNQERDILCKVLQETGFNRTAAANKLGLSLRQIRYRIARLNIVTPGGDNTIDEHQP
ncbi:MAG TPA: sigma-54 dependent transcriptional regulator [Polaromonas sp.]|uniref:sigma-54-dependent transcriptional regulator n=1 Tax=Polaromonas sp. TaxID=1869339 RepID=UPI002D74FCEB|nr:sigma-54 dependent transcriptional regulator [Polaromonas sp.]HYW58608.1 sigma-54 dependent transcriptional regulator [Polaromonas sp.]